MPATDPPRNARRPRPHYLGQRCLGDLHRCPDGVRAVRFARAASDPAISVGVPRGLVRFLTLGLEVQPAGDVRSTARRTSPNPTRPDPTRADLTVSGIKDLTRRVVGRFLSVPLQRSDGKTCPPPRTSLVDPDLRNVRVVDTSLQWANAGHGVIDGSGGALRVEDAQGRGHVSGSPCPPSTTRTAPVTNDADSCARNRAQAATSSGVPLRPAGPAVAAAASNPS